MRPGRAPSGNSITGRQHRAAEIGHTLTLLTPSRRRIDADHSPFSEVRETERQATLFVIATAAVGASASLVAALFLSNGLFL